MAISEKRARQVQDKHYDMMRTLEECKAADANNKSMAYYAATGVLLRSGEYLAYLRAKLSSTLDASDKSILELWIRELEVIRKSAAETLETLETGE